MTARIFKFGILKEMVVPDNFLDPDPEIETLFNDGQILSGVSDDELISPQPGLFSPSKPRRPKK
jgi:hypothetical protein